MFPLAVNLLKKEKYTMAMTQIQPTNKEIQSFINEVAEMAKVFADDTFAFQVKEWKDGISFVNYAGGYRTNPDRDTFFGHTIAMIRGGKITMKEYSPKVIKARKIMNAVATKFGMELIG
jgi:hypothetical protein